MIAFLSVQYPVLGATTNSLDIQRRMYTSHRNPSGWSPSHEDQPSLERMNEFEDPISPLMSLPLADPDLTSFNNLLRQQRQSAALRQSAKQPSDFSEWVQVQLSETEDLLPPTTSRSKSSYIIPVVSSTVVKPIGRILWSTAKGTYYSLPYAGSGGWWLGRRTAQALGAAISTTDDAATYIVEAVRDVQARRATAEEKGWDAGKRTASTIGNAFKWLGNTTVEGVEGTALPLWNGTKWVAKETWENSKAAFHDMREAYLDDVWASVKSKATKVASYVEEKISSFASKVKAAASRLGSQIVSGVKSIGSSVAAKVNNVWGWLTSRLHKHA